MEFGILGPLEVRVEGRAVEFGGPRSRALLGVLALPANQPVSAERLAVALWGEGTPPRAVKTVQVYVARLRKALGDPELLIAGSGAATGPLTGPRHPPSPQTPYAEPRTATRPFILKAGGPETVPRVRIPPPPF